MIDCTISIFLWCLRQIPNLRKHVCIRICKSGFAIFVMLLEFEGDLDDEKYKPENMIGTKGVGKVQERKWWKISGTRKCHLAERGCCTSKLALAWHPLIGGTDQSLFLCLPPRLICLATLPPQLTPLSCLVLCDQKKCRIPVGD